MSVPSDSPADVEPSPPEIDDAPLVHREQPRHAARVATFNYAELAEPSSPQVPDEDVARLVERRDPAPGLPACSACHGSNSGGPIETPALSRQSKEYLASQLRAFKGGTRRNDIYTRMRSIAAKLTEREVDALADFFSDTANY